MPAPHKSKPTQPPLPNMTDVIAVWGDSAVTTFSLNSIDCIYYFGRSKENVQQILANDYFPKNAEHITEPSDLDISTFNSELAKLELNNLYDFLIIFDYDPGDFFTIYIYDSAAEEVEVIEFDVAKIDFQLGGTEDYYKIEEIYSKKIISQMEKKFPQIISGEVGIIFTGKQVDTVKNSEHFLSQKLMPTLFKFLPHYINVYIDELNLLPYVNTYANNLTVSNWESCLRQYEFEYVNPKLSGLSPNLIFTKDRHHFHNNTRVNTLLVNSNVTYYQMNYFVGRVSVVKLDRKRKNSNVSQDLFKYIVDFDSNGKTYPLLNGELIDKNEVIPYAIFARKSHIRGKVVLNEINNGIISIAPLKSTNQTASNESVILNAINNYNYFARDNYEQSAGFYLNTIPLEIISSEIVSRTNNHLDFKELIFFNNLTELEEWVSNVSGDKVRFNKSKFMVVCNFDLTEEQLLRMWQDQIRQVICHEIINSQEVKKALLASLFANMAVGTFKCSDRIAAGLIFAKLLNSAGKFAALDKPTQTLQIRGESAAQGSKGQKFASKFKSEAEEILILDDYDNSEEVAGEIVLNIYPNARIGSLELTKEVKQLLSKSAIDKHTIQRLI